MIDKVAEITVWLQGLSPEEVEEAEEVEEEKQASTPPSSVGLRRVE